MNEQSFSLIPFPAPALPALEITGTLSFQDNLLTLRYFLTGSIEDILLSPRSPNPGRKDELWKATCFEFFLALRDQPDYWEFNMSPSGDWNIYHMDEYRRLGFREETAISQLPFQFKQESHQYLLDVSVDLTPLLRSPQEVLIAITAIMQTKDSNETYWALTHPAPYADFHLRESFILTLAGQAHLSEQSARDG